MWLARASVSSLGLNYPESCFLDRGRMRMSTGRPRLVELSGSSELNQGGCGRIQLVVSVYAEPPSKGWNEVLKPCQVWLWWASTSSSSTSSTVASVSSSSQSISSTILRCTVFVFFSSCVGECLSFSLRPCHLWVCDDSSKNCWRDRLSMHFLSHALRVEIVSALFMADYGKLWHMISHETGNDPHFGFNLKQVQTSLNMFLSRFAFRSSYLLHFRYIQTTGCLTLKFAIVNGSEE